MKEVTKLKKIRINLGFTQADLCELAGVNKHTIIKLEKGEVGTAKVDTLKKVAIALDTNIIDLFFEEELKGELHGQCITDN